MNYEDTDHIILDSASHQYECKHCGTIQPPPHMPCAVNIIVDAIDVFVAAHKDCKAPIPEAVMSDYVKGFDHGCDYIIKEIELWEKEVGQDLDVLIRHLKMEDKKTSK